MDLLQAIVIGIVQGLTEFLPISSTAHMKVVPVLLGWEDPGPAFSAVVQLGTLVAVLVYFRDDLVRIFWAVLDELRTGNIAQTPDGRMGWMIALGTIPIVVCGLVFKKWIETTLRSLYVISAALIGVALLLAIAEVVVSRRRKRGELGRDIDQTRWSDAIVVGCSQAAALIPGTSRSGATILGGLCCGLSRETAARFSFLLSVPAIAAAAFLQLYKARHELLANQSQITNIVAATVVAGIVGYASIPWLLGFLRKHSTFIFIGYRIALGVLLLALLASGKLRDDSPAGTPPSAMVPTAIE